MLGGALPNPRDISNTIHYGGITPPRSRVLSHVVAYFGQFAGHDMVSNPNVQKGMRIIFFYLCIIVTPAQRLPCNLISL